MFDGQGIRLTPSHAKNGQRRYRYYIHPIGTPGASKPALRIPAQELEDAVLGALASWLRDESRLLGFMKGIDADVVARRLQEAGALAARLESGSAGNRIELLKRLVGRITVGTESIEIVVRIAAIWLSGLSDESPIGGDVLTSIVVPVQLKRCGLAVRLIVRAAWGGKARAPDPRLVALLAKAQRWFASLSSGRSDSVLSIAQEHGMASSEVTRVIYLAFLAPDIVQQIVRGEQPVEMNIKRLLAAAPLPLDWAEQRRVLGLGG